MTSEIDYDVRDLTMGRVWERQARRHADKPFLTYLPDGRRFTYAEADRLTNRLSNGLLAQGIGHGTHVAVMLENCPEQLFLFMALGKIGAVAVPLNTACKGQVLTYYLSQSDATALILGAEFLDRFHEVRERVPAIAQVVMLAEAPAGDSALIPYRALEVADDQPPPVTVRCSDLAMLAYTSGTTGPSKGCMHSQAASLTYGLSNAETHGHQESDVFYICLPLFHANALQTQAFCALLVGGSIALAPRFSVSRFWEEVRCSGATITNLLGSMTAFLWSREPDANDPNNRLRLVSSTPFPKFASGFEERFGLRLISNYGLSDYVMATGFRADDPAEKRGSAGRVRKGIQIRILDEDDLELPAGQVGEIGLRCDRPWQAASGYYNMPEKTIEAFRNLIFHTGDRGYLDADGFLYFVDRKKDAIRRRGENISAFEVEQIIAQHPAVAEAAVYPLPAESSEDEVAASVVLRDGAALTEAELTSYCARNMSYFMVPRYIHFCRDLPRTMSQKVEKHRLREEAMRNPEALWDRERHGIVVSR